MDIPLVNVGRRAFLDKLAFTNNGRKHSWQKAETRLVTNQPVAPGAACSRSRTSATWRGREHGRRRTLREQQISGKHWVTSGRDEPQSMSRDLLPRARSNEVWTSLLNYTSCQPLMDQFLSHGPLSLSPFLSFFPSLWNSPTLLPSSIHRCWHMPTSITTFVHFVICSRHGSKELFKLRCKWL